MAATESNKKIARTAASAFGGKARVITYHDNDNKSHIGILDCVDRPEQSMTAFSTVGCSDFSLYRNGEVFLDDEKKKPVGVELVGACASKFDYFANALATAAFCIGNSRWFCAPGIVFPDVFAMHAKDAQLKHMLFVPPFFWDDTLPTLKLADKTVEWLLAVPISDAEMRFAEERRTSSDLEDIFEKKDVDIFDLNRKSVV